MSRTPAAPRAPITGVILSIVIALFALAGETSAQQPVPALLPDKTTEPPGPPMPIDGIWRIDAVGARVRIEGGRMFALDPWLHLFVMQIKPGMIVTKDIERVGPGRYTGYDLPNLGTWTGTLNDNQQLQVRIAGKLAPIELVLTSLAPDDVKTFRAEREAQLRAGGGS